MKKSEIKIGSQCMVTDKSSIMYGKLVTIHLDNIVSGTIPCILNETIKDGLVTHPKGNMVRIEYKHLIERDNCLITVNEHLYKTLLVFWSCNKGHAGGSLDYPSKSYQWIKNTLDLIKVKYFCEEPDGDYEWELYDNKKPYMTDKEAYDELLTRLNNTDFTI